MIDTNDILTSIASAAGRARRGELRFWLLTLVWIAILGGFSYTFYDYLKGLEQEQEQLQVQQDEAQNSIHEHEEMATQQMMRLKALQTRNEAIARRLERFEGQLLAALPPAEQMAYAIDLAEAQMARTPLSPKLVAFTETQGRRLLGKETTAEAPVVAESIEASMTRDNSLHYRQGLFELIGGDYERAIEELDAAAAENPRDIRPRLAKARALQKLGQHEAVILLLGGVDDAELGASGLTIRAFSLLKTSALDMARSNCTRAIEADNDYWVPYNYRGFINLLDKDYEGAMADWRDAADRRPGIEGHAASLENVALALLNQEMWAETLQHTSFVLALDDSLAWTWLFRFIAAEELDEPALRDAAHVKWSALRAEGDAEILKGYLEDARLFPFLDAPAPGAD